MFFLHMSFCSMRLSLAAFLLVSSMSAKCMNPLAFSARIAQIGEIASGSTDCFHQSGMQGQYCSIPQTPNPCGCHYGWNTAIHRRSTSA